MVLKDELVTNLSDGNRQGEQAVIICLQFPVGKFQEKKAFDAVLDLDNIFCSVIEASAVGRYEGYDFFEGSEEEQITFSMYGQDANKMYAEIRPILELLPNLSNISIYKQYAKLRAYEEQASLS